MESANEKEELKCSHRVLKNGDAPVVKPEDCPGGLIKYFNRKRKADHIAYQKMLQKELEPLKDSWIMTGQNRQWLVGLSTLLGLVIIALVIVATQT